MNRVVDDGHHIQSAFQARACYLCEAKSPNRARRTVGRAAGHAVTRGETRTSASSSNPAPARKSRRGIRTGSRIFGILCRGSRASDRRQPRYTLRFDFRGRSPHHQNPQTPARPPRSALKTTHGWSRLAMVTTSANLLGINDPSTRQRKTVQP
jgi:hypothetical protein